MIQSAFRNPIRVYLWSLPVALLTTMLGWRGALMCFMVNAGLLESWLRNHPEDRHVASPEPSQLALPEGESKALRPSAPPEQPDPHVSHLLDAWFYARLGCLCATSLTVSLLTAFTRTEWDSSPQLAASGVHFLLALLCAAASYVADWRLRSRKPEN